MGKAGGRPTDADADEGAVAPLSGGAQGYRWLPGTGAAAASCSLRWETCVGVAKEAAAAAGSRFRAAASAKIRGEGAQAGKGLSHPPRG